jgi:hypothetical protein
MLIQTGTMPLPAAMASIQGRYAKQFNRQRGYRGRVWQSRYKTKLILDDEHLRHVIAYIHLNPVAAYLVDDPLSYTRSGHREVMGIRAPCLCDVVRCLQCFAEDRSTAQAIYLDRLRIVAEERWFRAGIRELPWWKAVADDEQRVNPRNAPDDAYDFEGRPLLSGEHERPPLPQVLEIFEQEIGISAGRLAGNGRTRILSWYRCLFATFAVSWLGHRSKDVAAILDKGPGSVSRWVAEGLELQLSEPSFRWPLEMLAKALGQEWSDAPSHGSGDV